MVLPGVPAHFTGCTTYGTGLREREEFSCCGHRVPASLGSDSVQFGEQEMDRLTGAEELFRDSRSDHVSGSRRGRSTEWCSTESLEETSDIVSKRECVRFHVGNSERRIEKIFKARRVAGHQMVVLPSSGGHLEVVWYLTQKAVGKHPRSIQPGVVLLRVDVRLFLKL